MVIINHSLGGDLTHLLGAKVIMLRPNRNGDRQRDAAGRDLRRGRQGGLPA